MNDCKEYAVTLTATARKTVTVKAATDLEALELIEHLLACTDILDFTPENVSQIDVRCAADRENHDCRCEGCEYHCTTCGTCLSDEDSEICAGCEDCEYQCPECGGCLHEDEDD